MGGSHRGWGVGGGGWGDGGEGFGGGRVGAGRGWRGQRAGRRWDVDQRWTHKDKSTDRFLITHHSTHII